MDLLRLKPNPTKPRPMRARVAGAGTVPPESSLSISVNGFEVSKRNELHPLQTGVVTSIRSVQSLDALYWEAKEKSKLLAPAESPGE